MANYGASATRVASNPYARYAYQQLLGRDIYAASQIEKEALAKTLTGATVAGAGNSISDEFGTVVGGGSALMLGLTLAWKGAKGTVYSGPKWLWQNRGNYSSAWDSSVRSWKANHSIAGKETLQNLKGNNFLQTTNNINKYGELSKLQKQYSFNANPSALDPNMKGYEKALKKQNFLQGKQKCFQQAVDKIAEIKKGVKAGTLKGDALKTAMKEAKQLVRQGELAFQEGLASGAIKRTSKIGRAWQSIKNGTGLSKLSVGLSKAAAKSTAGASVASKAGTYAARGVKSFTKGGGAITAAIMLACDAPEIYQTYNELGAGAGTKQLAKSAGVAVATGAGYVAGSWAGGKIGAAIGTAICPGLGTVIGGVLGVVGGLAVSFFAEKGARALVGKSELEKHKEKQAKELAQNDEQLLSEGVQAAQDGRITELEEIETLEKIAQEMNALAADAYADGGAEEYISVDTSMPELEYSA